VIPSRAWLHRLDLWSANFPRGNLFNIGFEYFRPKPSTGLFERKRHTSGDELQDLQYIRGYARQQRAQFLPVLSAGGASVRPRKQKVEIDIISTEREYGCCCGDIAQLVASRPGRKLWGQRLTEEIASMANCSKVVIEAREERNDPRYYRLFKSFMRGSYEGRHRCAPAESGRYQSSDAHPKSSKLRCSSQISQRTPNDEYSNSTGRPASAYCPNNNP
jgi:hypothetical protein